MNIAGLKPMKKNNFTLKSSNSSAEEFELFKVKLFFFIGFSPAMFINNVVEHQKSILLTIRVLKNHLNRKVGRNLKLKI